MTDSTIINHQHISNGSKQNKGKPWWLTVGPGFGRRRGDLKGTEVGAGGDGEDVCGPVAPLEHRKAREELLPGGVLAASPGQRRTSLGIKSR